jgi:hypothetical protein
MSSDMNATVTNSEPAQVSANSNSSVETQAPITEAQPSQSQQQERYFTQEEVNKIVGKERSQIRESMKQRVDQQQAPNAISREEARQIFAEESKRNLDEMQRQAQVAQVSKTAEEIMQKVNLSKDEFPELGPAMRDTRWDKITGLADVAVLAHQMGENTAAILNEVLVANPNKLVSLANLAAANPIAARKQIELLSQSITENKTAKNRPVADKPLSQIKPSNTAIDNGKQKTVSDYRRLDLLRG